MKVTRVECDWSKAQQMLRAYREHKNAMTDIDAKMEAVYRQIMRGRKVIQAFESIRQAGLDEKGRPRLAIVRADVKICRCARHWEGDNNRDALRFSEEHTGRGKLSMPFPGLTHWTNARAIVPHIPIHLRPKAQLHNYHILWEADWEDVPIDPMLLRRVGDDVWVVLAAWDLTPVERAVLRGA